MKKLICLLLAAVLLLFGCASNGGPATEPTSPTESNPAPFAYETLLEDAGSFGQPEPQKPAVTVFQSKEDCSDRILELVEPYGDNFFEDHSLIAVSYMDGYYIIRHRVLEVVETELGGYLIKVEECFPEVEAMEDMCGYSAVLIAVNRVIPKDAVIQVETSNVTMPVKDYNEYFGEDLPVP